MKKIAIASDHAGLTLKNHLKQHLKDLGYEVVDRGCQTQESVDYPDFAKLVANDVQKGSAWRGVLICGTGIGMALTANRFSKVRAASITDIYSAKMARAHNDLNLLCLGGRVVGIGLAEEILKIVEQKNLKGEFVLILDNKN